MREVGRVTRPHTVSNASASETDFKMMVLLLVCFKRRSQEPSIHRAYSLFCDPRQRTKRNFATFRGGVFVFRNRQSEQALAEIFGTRCFAVLRDPSGLQKGFWTGLNLKPSAPKPCKGPRSQAGRRLQTFVNGDQKARKSGGSVKVGADEVGGHHGLVSASNFQKSSC